MNRLKEKYEKTIVSDLMSKHNYANVMEVPKLEKIVVNIGCGDATSNSKLLEAAIHASNVMILDPKTKKPTRIGHSINKDGKKIRVSKKSNSSLD